MIKIKEPQILPEYKEIYDSLKSLYSIIFEIKQIWFSSPSSSKTVDLITDVDVDIFSCLYSIENGTIRKPSFTLKELQACFRKPRFKNAQEVDWEKLKERAISLYNEIDKSN